MRTTSSSLVGCDFAFGELWSGHPWHTFARPRKGWRRGSGALIVVTWWDITSAEEEIQQKHSKK